MSRTKRMYDYRKMTKVELELLRNEFKLNLMKNQAKFSQEKMSKKYGKDIKGSSVMKNLRKEIARINTLLKERELKGGLENG